MDEMKSDNCELFCFDDLLVSVCQEIMANGMETSSVPETIKDWLSGKLVRALPKRLTQRLLAFFLDNRDMEGVLAFKENNYAETPEFTDVLGKICLIIKLLSFAIFGIHLSRILMYRTEKARLRKEKQEIIKRRTQLENGILEEETETPPDQVFSESQIVDDSGIQFFGEELVVDPTQLIPLKGGVRRPVVSDYLAPKIDKIIDSSDDHVSSADGSESEYIPKTKRKRQRKAYKKKGNSREAAEKGLINSSGSVIYTRACEVCYKPFHRPIRLYKHQAKEHPDWFAQNPPPKKLTENREQVLCRICQPNQVFFTRVQLLQHQKSEHPDFWAGRNASATPIVVTNEQKIQTYPEIQICNTTGSLTDATQTQTK